jgi:predicted transposase YdaD
VEEWLENLDQELDSQLELELLVLEMKSVAQELGFELQEVLQAATEILKDLKKELE